MFEGRPAIRRRRRKRGVYVCCVCVCVLGTSQAINVHMIGCACAMIGCVRAMVPWICSLPRLLLSRGLFVCVCVVNWFLGRLNWGCIIEFQNKTKQPMYLPFVPFLHFCIFVIFVFTCRYCVVGAFVRSFVLSFVTTSVLFLRENKTNRLVC